MTDDYRIGCPVCWPEGSTKVAGVCDDCIVGDPHVLRDYIDRGAHRHVAAELRRHATALDEQANRQLDVRDRLNGAHNAGRARELEEEARAYRAAGARLRRRADELCSGVAVNAETVTGCTNADSPGTGNVRVSMTLGTVSGTVIGYQAGR